VRSTRSTWLHLEVDPQLPLSTTVSADWQQLQAELARINVTAANQDGDIIRLGGSGVVVAGLLMGGAYIFSRHLVLASHLFGAIFQLLQRPGPAI